MPGIGLLNLKVFVFDSDFYSLQAINSYLAWDRRTRVTYMTHDARSMWKRLNSLPHAELPDIVVLDADHLGGPDYLRVMVEELRRQVPGVRVVCMVQQMDLQLAEAACLAGAVAFFLKQEVRLHIAWAICYTLEYDFLVTQSVADLARNSAVKRLFDAVVLPEQREYPEMTDRVRQAIKLCVIEGMPAHLAADEMGISLHTIRGYIKEGYRILESYDQYEYPTDMTPQERAFMRFTALEDLENPDS